MHPHLLPLLTLSLSGAWAASPETNSYSDASHALCQKLHSQIPSRVAYSSVYNTTEYGSLTAAYLEATTRYNNLANRDDIPACVLFPSSAADVSVAMKLLHKSPTVPFALKSGGHDWNRGFSSTNGGLLISFRPNLNYTTLSKDKNSVEVGPGSRWHEVLSTLDPHGRAVVGGRYGDVGVGGLIPRGGISHLTPEHGFASDNVISFEVVLANGTIVTASKTSHKELYFSLRGGGGMFGAITKFILQAHPIADVWGGDRTYASNQTQAILHAVSKYTSSYNDTKAALTPTLLKFSSSLGGAATWTLTYFYNGTTPPAHVFAELLAIPCLNDSVATKRYPLILAGAGPQASAPEFRAAGAFNSLPNLPEAQMVPFMTSTIERMTRASFATVPDIDFDFFDLAFQPMPVALQHANAVRGPAALSLDPSAGDKIWVEYTLGWSDPRCDFTCMRALRGVVDGVQSAMQDNHPGVKPTNWKAGDVDKVGYAPLFANDAMWGQNVYESYGEVNYARLRAARKAYDPQGVFLSQTSQFTL